MNNDIIKQVENILKMEDNSKKTEEIIDLIYNLGTNLPTLMLYEETVGYVEAFCENSDTLENRDRINKETKEYVEKGYWYCDDISEMYLEILDDLDIEDDDD